MNSNDGVRKAGSRIVTVWRFNEKKRKIKKRGREYISCPVLDLYEDPAEGQRVISGIIGIIMGCCRACDLVILI